MMPLVASAGAHKVGKVGAGRLVGRSPLEPRIRDRTGCTVVAVERAGEVIMNIPESFALTQTDAVYVCGTVDAFNGFYEEFAEASA